jgi:glutathione synthase/RimK-type ligase-like ATP-grasp enzyme
MAAFEADVAILMPKISDTERFSIRYAGLSAELGMLGISHFFADGHVSYDVELNEFGQVFDVTRQRFDESGAAPVVRDLTMPKRDMPLYHSGARLVHDPRTNSFLADKSNLYLAAPGIHPTTALVTHNTVSDGLDVVPGERVLVKPVSGMLSQGVQVLPKLEAAKLELPDGRYMLQEFIDTSGGVPQLGIEGVHNVRGITIGGLIIGGIARVQTDGGNILRDDIYGRYVGPDELPESMQAIASTVHGVMAELPGNNKNVLAIDFMRGVNAAGELVDVLCETNRRPMRISAYNLNKGNLDDDGIRILASQWDKAEAEMLAEMVA